MKKVYIAKPGQRDPIPTDEEALRTLWERGLLSDDLLFWQSDAKRWVRLSECFQGRSWTAGNRQFHPACLPEKPASRGSIPHRRPTRRFSLREPGAHPRPPSLGGEEFFAETPTVLPRRSQPQPTCRADLGHYFLTAMLTVIVLGILAGSSQAEFRWLGIILIGLVGAYAAGIVFAGTLGSRFRELVSGMFDSRDRTGR